MKKINSLITYFVPQKYSDDKELNRKSRFIVWFVFITTIISVFFGFLSAVQNPSDITNPLAAILILPLFIIALFHFRKKGSFIITTHFICGLFTLAMCFMPNSTGGLFSPDMPTSYILPVFALIMGNYRIGVFYGLFTISIFVGYYLIDINDNASIHLKQLNALSPDYFFFNLTLNFLVISFLVFRNENLRQKLLGELQETNLIISEKSKEITDSINYAKRIQTAILPEHSTIKNHFPNSFTLYLPKDIVSGDFYWMTEKDGFQFLAIADCTGHGVPGALMSVIGVNQLNDIVQEKAILHPSQILENLNRNINKILKQNQNEINDGMDIAVLKINMKDKWLDYAGANRPLYYIRNKELTEIKATKLPIGGYDFGKEKKFESIHLQLQTGDLIYLSTDGYADQFGGETGNKKLTTKKFKKLILSIQDNTMQEQETILHKFITDYRKDVEQIDDILVMGVKI